MKIKSFSNWMGQVDTALENMIGISSSDLGDCPYMDWWQEGMAPNVAARKAIKRNF